MRLKNYLILLEKLNMKGTMIGYDVDKTTFDSIIKKIGSILEKNGISYSVIENPHITIAQISGKAPKDELVRNIHKIDTIRFNPQKINIFYGPNVKKYFVVIEYKVRKEFLDLYNELSSKYEVNVFPGGVKPHVSIAMIEEEMDKQVLKEIMSSKLNLPVAKTKSVVLYNNKFKLEYKD